MNPSFSPSVLDMNGLAAIQRLVRNNDPQGVRAAAQQFEALFLQQVMQAMREATPQDDMFDSDQTRMYQSLLDQQMVQAIVGKGNGTGLAAMIEKQLGRPNADPQAYPQGLPLSPPRAQPMDLQPKSRPLPDAAQERAAPAISPTPPPAGAQEFIRRVWPHATDASRATGVPPHFIAAQAALESGWGSSEPRRLDGTPSYNLFGIKAGASWTGAVAEATTTEVVNGIAQKRVERFRAYSSYAEAFQDYSRLLTNHPRFTAVLRARDGASFGRAMQQAGYASDPSYAVKLETIISSSALRATAA